MSFGTVQTSYKAEYSYESYLAGRSGRSNGSTEKFLEGFHSDENAVCNKKSNWLNSAKSAYDIFMGNPQTYGQAMKCQNRISALQGYIERSRKASGVSDDKAADYDKTVSAYYTKVSGENHYTDPKNGKTVYSGYNGYTFYTKEGIFYMQSGCDTKSMEYRDTVEWTVKFNSDGDYERAMDFLSKFPESDSKKFAANEQFWNDFVDGKIDEEDFMKFYDTLDHGVARCVKTDENGNDRIDMDMARSKYFNYFSGSDFRPLTYEQVVEKFLEGSRLGKSAEDKSPQNVLSSFFKDADKRMFSFINEEMQYSLQDWISEIINRARGGLLEQLAAK